MIGFPPHQQVSFMHLILSIILLLLTAYPYLFNHTNISYSVAALQIENVDYDLKHHYIDSFDVIKSSDIFVSKSKSTRDTEQHLLHTDTDNHRMQSHALLNDNALQLPHQSNIRKIEFSSLGRRFKLILKKTAHLVTNDLSIVSLDEEGKETKVPYNRDDLRVLDGFIEGENESKASTSLDPNDKLMIAHIKTGSDTIIVEPTYLHKDNLQVKPMNSVNSSEHDSNIYSNTMIVYKLHDHKQFKTQGGGSPFDPGSLCGAVNVTGSNSQNSTAEDIDQSDKFFYNRGHGAKSSKIKRGIDFLSHDQARDKIRCTLHLVADYLFYKNIGNGDMQTTINYLLALIDRVNHIYLPTVWETDDEQSQSFTNIGFTVQNITIHQNYTKVMPGSKHYNMQSDKPWSAREYLDDFSVNSPPRHYCLAHLLTYRQFDSPVLGLAYVASTRFGTIGGICSPAQLKDKTYSKHNTGISSSKGIHGETLITRQADLVVAHELGHNLGAEHDSNECRPGPSNGGAYLMHPFAVMGFEKNNRFLSNCSRLSIGRVLKRKAETCFVAVIDHVCGNGIVEDDEECDGGDIGHEHNDPCCDSTCRFTPGSQCSDRHSWCCSKCHINTAGVPCRAAEEYNCKQATYCDGQSPECPSNSPPVEDHKTCVGRGECLGGECIPFCEAKGIHSCLCKTPADACKLCCRTSLNSTCSPYDKDSLHLPDGLSCYNGICEKGRCEQPIQDLVERLWDVIEDINFTSFIKFLRDNIILVVLVVSIPIWWLATYFINKFDRQIQEDILNAIKMNIKRRRLAPSPFLPSLFVGHESSNSNLRGNENFTDYDVQQPLKPPLNSINGDPPSEPTSYGWRLETNV